MNNILRNTSLFVFSVLLLAACRKDQANADLTAAQNEAFFHSTEKAYQNEIDAITLKSASQSNLCNPLQWLPECVEVTDTGVDTYPRTIVLDFGDGCTGPGGVERAGVLHIEVSGPMNEAGSVCTVTFENFSVNGNALEGTRTTTSNGSNAYGQPQFTRVVDMAIERNIGTFQRSFTQNVTWISGFDTEPCGDNVFEVSGNGTVTRPNGTTISRTIIEPLTIDRVCGYVTAGVVVVDAPMGERTIDFGDGACDDDATVTIDGETYEIDLD